METPEKLFEDATCSLHHPYESPDDYLIKPQLDFTVDDLLDFSNSDALCDDNISIGVAGGASSLSSAIISCPASEASCLSFPGAPFPGADLYVPYEEVAELEWLSNFVEESFSSNDLQKLETVGEEEEEEEEEGGREEKRVRGKARSKRGRGGECKWRGRGLVSPTTSSEEGGESRWEKKEVVGEKREREEQGGRRCVHCDTDKTPQWRTGPMGPKTLCNACGVRYKSGRLVPEYRPASSPTFVIAKHSNSHRKVMELRRQKETHLHHQQRLHLQLLEDTITIEDAVYDHHQDDHHYVMNMTDTWVNHGSFLL